MHKMITLLICKLCIHDYMALLYYRYVQAFVASQIVGRQGDFWIGLTQSYDTGITESWTSGQDVKFTYWSNQHTGESAGL